MKKLSLIIAGLMLTIFSFLAGFFIRQPSINKLKKQIELLQKDNGRLLSLCQKYQKDFEDLLLQQKLHKLQQFKLKDKIKESLTMQYAILEYVNILFKRVKYGAELKKDEVLYLKSFEKVINGVKLSSGDQARIYNLVNVKYAEPIKHLQKCDYTLMLEELQIMPQAI